MKRFTSIHRRVAEIAIFFLLATGAHAGELGINIHGLSYHPDRRDSNGRKFEEVNVGAGIHYLFYNKARNSLALEGGIFRNSNDDAAEYGALSYRFRIVRGFAAGAGLTALHSSAVNRGNFVVAPLPLICYRYRSIAFQMLYAPEIGDWNRNAVFSFYVTIFFR